MEKIILDKKNYAIIIVPPGVWFSFTTKNKISVVANFLNNSYSDNETLKMNKMNKMKKNFYFLNIQIKNEIQKIFTVIF